MHADIIQENNLTHSVAVAAGPCTYCLHCDRL